MATVLRRARRYVPRAVQPFLTQSNEFWGSEMRRVSVLFVNLGFVDHELAKLLDESFAIRLNRAFRCVQDAIYMYDGTINKFLVDDKGSTLIACFGLPPSSHENDAPRSVLAAMALTASLRLDGLHASVGVTNGLVFCGVVGHLGGRREYTVLGDTVNLSARLMQHAMKSQGKTTIVVDGTTEYLSKTRVDFDHLGGIHVKGKAKEIDIYAPKSNSKEQEQEDQMTLAAIAAVSAVSAVSDVSDVSDVSSASYSTATAKEEKQGLPDDILFASKRRSRSVRSRGDRSREKNNKDTSRISLSLIHVHDERIASTREMEKTVATLEHWRKHVQTFAGSHSSLSRRTASMLSMEEMEEDTFNTSKNTSGEHQKKLSESQINPFFLDPERRKENQTLTPLDIILTTCEKHLGMKSVKKKNYRKGKKNIEKEVSKVIVLEGQVGSGKTHILAKIAIACEEVSSSGRTVYAVAANPFERGLLSRPYGIWQDVVESLLIDEEMRKEMIEDDKDDTNVRNSSQTHLSQRGALTLRQMKVFKEVAEVHRREMKMPSKERAVVVEGSMLSPDTLPIPLPTSSTSSASSISLPLPASIPRATPIRNKRTKRTQREEILGQWLHKKGETTTRNNAMKISIPDHSDVLDVLFATNFSAEKQTTRNASELEFFLKSTPTSSSDPSGPLGHKRSSVETPDANVTQKIANSHLRRMSNHPEQQSLPPPSSSSSKIPSSSNSKTTLDVEEDKEDKEQDVLPRDAVADVFCRALFNATINKPIVILVDDSHALDNKAWEIAAAISKHVPSVLIVMSTRPMVMHRRRFGAVPVGYDALVQLNNCLHLSLSKTPLHNSVIDAIVKKDLNVNMVPERLLCLIRSRARGNPLFAREFTTALLTSGSIVIDSSTQSIGSKQVLPLHTVVDQESMSCTICGRKFNLLHRRYMCRGCGNTFCSEHCSSMKLNLGYIKVVRHCLRCFDGDETNSIPNKKEQKKFEKLMSQKIDTPGTYVFFFKFFKLFLTV